MLRLRSSKTHLKEVPYEIVRRSGSSLPTIICGDGGIRRVSGLPTRSFPIDLLVIRDFLKPRQTELVGVW